MYDGHGLGLLKRGIYERQEELHNLAKILSDSAGKLGRIGAIARVAIIVLGAVVATQGVADRIAGEGSVGVLIGYTLCGILITAISGLGRFQDRVAGNRVESACSNVPVHRLANG